MLKGSCLGERSVTRWHSLWQDDLRALQNLRKTEIDKAELERAVECVRFCVRVADYQRSKGRFFYFEHPLTARSWQSVDELWELMGRDDVEAVTVHVFLG